MLVFKMDTTNFFKNGQKHELRISLPRDKHKQKNANGYAPSKNSTSVSTTNGAVSSHHHGSSNSSSGSSRRGSLGGLSNGSVRRHHSHRDTHNHHRQEINYSNGLTRHGSRAGYLNGETAKEVRFSKDVAVASEPIKYVRFDQQPPPRRHLRALDPAVIPECDSHDSEGNSNASSVRSSSSRSSNSSSGVGVSHGMPKKKRRDPNKSSIRKKHVQDLQQQQPGGSDESAHGLVTIRMKPDDGGKFGFNVKGGADQNLPVLVSRVAPNTPADRCYPRLNEGDQVLLINGRDVSAMTHEQVVNFIRASRECHSGELVLTVKQNVYLAEELEEPAFQYVPEALPSTVSSVGVSGGQAAPLHESMLLLSEGLEAGSLVAQFEQLYRRKPGLTVSEARRQENEKKNRYRDISPYDTTRVLLTNASSGDYINASYVNMEIQGSGIVNRYIACQGPLAGTCADFWQMVWEQQSTLIVMLTTVVEQGRVKCHRYWPRLYETVDFGRLQVTCLKEEETPGFAFREFTLINTENQDERHITHMQYLAWPDHGVPDDSTEFLNFIAQVRSARAGMVEPTIVHCSAGIGRTGVLILMETAQCLIEANEPVYPLDVVRAMRDQRAMMIQTASQYRFVCEAIQRVYSEGLVKPLAEYQQR